MYAILMFMLSIVSLIAWRKTMFGNKYRLDLLALISISAAVMFIVDMVFEYVESGELLIVQMELLSNTVVLVSFTVFLWIIALKLVNSKSGVSTKPLVNKTST
ncbi:MAG: hypothetical protein QXE81_05080 [Desulfurococcaceae archaeon]